MNPGNTTVGLTCYLKGGKSTLLSTEEGFHNMTLESILKC